MEDSVKDPSKVAAALARAEALTSKERSAIARRAALVRYGKNLPKAIAEGTLQIGDLRLPCAVLDDAEEHACAYSGGIPDRYWARREGEGR